MCTLDGPKQYLQSHNGVGMNVYLPKIRIQTPEEGSVRVAGTREEREPNPYLPVGIRSQCVKQEN